MAQSIDNVVKIEVDISVTSAAAENLKLPLLVGEASEFPVGFTDSQRIRFYSSLTDVAKDFAPLSNIYKLAQAVFAQKTVSQIAIGKKASGDADYQTALNAISNVNNDWYGLAITSRAEADILSACAFAESNNKLASFASRDSGIIDSLSATDVMSMMKAAAYQNSFITYHSNADGQEDPQHPTDPVFIDGAALATLIGSEAGSLTLAHKTFSGIDVDNLTGSEQQVIENKNGNYYVVLAKQNKYFWGTTASKIYADITRDLFWFKRQIQLGVITLLGNESKVPFNARGLAMVESTIVAAADLAVTQEVLRSASKAEIATDLGILENQVQGYRPTFGYSLVIPDIASIPQADRANRNLTGVKFTGKFAGGIHTVDIGLKLSV